MECSRLPKPMGWGSWYQMCGGGWYDRVFRFLRKWGVVVLKDFKVSHCSAFCVRHIMLNDRRAHIGTLAGILARPSRSLPLTGRWVLFTGMSTDWGPCHWRVFGRNSCSLLFLFSIGKVDYRL